MSRTLRKLADVQDELLIWASALICEASSPRVQRVSAQEEQNPVVAAAVAPELGLLAVMTLNLQYFASFPKDEAEGVRRLRQATGGPCPPDVICVQEGIVGRNVLDAVGFDLLVCSGERGVAQSVRDMVYGDEATLRACDASVHEQLLCNQLYLRRGSPWQVVDLGAEQISSDHELVGSCGRAQGKLAVRSVTWAKLRKAGGAASDVFILNTHISGGRFEDQYFVQQLAQERREQPERIMALFEKMRAPDDIGIMVGDFNATSEYTQTGAMHSYFKFAIAGSEGVKSDARRWHDVDEDQLETAFASYMTSPFQAIQKRGWTFAYGKEVGITSAFGHLIDHMAVSRCVKVVSANVVELTNQKFGQQYRGTDVPVSDHNAVRTVFSLARNELGAQEAAGWAAAAEALPGPGEQQPRLAFEA